MERYDRFLRQSRAPACLDPTPEDTDLLWADSIHRAQLVWDKEGEMGVCRSRQTGSTTKWDDRYRPYLDRVRLSDVRQLKDVHSDETLITAFIERWRPETSTFHLPFGECTITLEDIAYLTGLPVDGDPVTRPIPTKWGPLFETLLGCAPPSIAPGTVKNSWLKAEFDTLPTDANDTTVECYVRAHILSMFGQFMFVERTGSVVHAYYLMVLEDWDVASRFSWGSAVLSVLYREMSKTVLSIQSTSSMRGDLGGWVSIVQLWAYERIPFLAPVPRSPVVRDLPLGLRWTKCSKSNEMLLYTFRLMLDELTEDSWVWHPYVGKDDALRSNDVRSLTFRAVTPLICFYSVMWHHPDRVLRQFGMEQPIPRSPRDRSEVLSLVKQGNRQHFTVLDHLAKYVKYWEGRCDHVAWMPDAHSQLHPHSEYLQWYNSITRRTISRRGAITIGQLNANERGYFGASAIDLREWQQTGMRAWDYDGYMQVEDLQPAPVRQSFHPYPDQEQLDMTVGSSRQRQRHTRIRKETRGFPHQHYVSYVDRPPESPFPPFEHDTNHHGQTSARRDSTHHQPESSPRSGPSDAHLFAESQHVECGVSSGIDTQPTQSTQPLGDLHAFLDTVPGLRQQYEQFSESRKGYPAPAPVQLSGPTLRPRDTIRPPPCDKRQRPRRRR